MANEPEEGHSPEDEEEGGPVKSFLEHLEDLRWVLIKSAVTVSVTMLLCLIAGNYVVGIIKRPLEKAQIRYPGEDKMAVLMFGTNRLGTYTLDLDQWDALNGGTNGNPSDFSASDIVDVKSLAGRLQAPSKGDAVSQYLTNELSAETRSLLTNYETGVGGMMRQIKNFFGRAQPTNGVSDDAMLRQALAGEFNRIIKTKTIYDAQRFKQVKLTPVTVESDRAESTGSGAGAAESKAAAASLSGGIAETPDGGAIRAAKRWDQSCSWPARG